MSTHKKLPTNSIMVAALSQKSEFNINSKTKFFMNTVIIINHRLNDYEMKVRVT